MSAKRFRLGLVVGKFAPLHLGHEWLIEQAAQACERLLLLSYTQPEFEGCEPARRAEWLRLRCPAHEAVVLDDARLAALCTAQGLAFQPIPPNTADDATQQRFLAWLLHSVLQRQPDALFCSEAYGPPCAALLSAEFGQPVQAVVVDPERRQVPISATRVRSDLPAHRAWLHPSVAASFVRRIAVLGGESSGKTTLAEALAARHHTLWVPEYGRERWLAQGGQLAEADLLAIAQEQLRCEAQAALQARALLFCDTTPLTTLGYAGWMFGRADARLAALAQRRYDGIVLCAPDFDFVQDGTRRDSAFRQLQHDWYLEALQALSTPRMVATGSLKQRLDQVTHWLVQTAAG